MFEIFMGISLLLVSLGVFVATIVLAVDIVRGWRR
jgi:hypothetical protein